jgi:hypothetical protein
VQIESGADLAMGQFKLHEVAISRMQAKGPNAAMQGNDPRDLSGRAILAQQAGGAAANEPLADGLRQWTRELYEIMWMAVREFWRGQRWLRVTDDLGKLKFVGINRQITLADRLAEMPEEMRGMALQRLGMVPNDPRLQQVVGTENDVSDLEVDITIEEGNDIPAMQAEQFQMLAQLAGSMPGVIPPDVLIRASSSRTRPSCSSMMKEHRGAGPGAAAAGTDGPGRGAGRGGGEADASAAQRGQGGRSAAHLCGAHRARPQGGGRKPGASCRGAGHPAAGATAGVLDPWQICGLSRRLDYIRGRPSWRRRRLPQGAVRMKRGYGPMPFCAAFRT